jgi:hypothetical protein
MSTRSAAPAGARAADAVAARRLPRGSRGGDQRGRVRAVGRVLGDADRDGERRTLAHLLDHLAEPLTGVVAVEPEHADDEQVLRPADRDVARSQHHPERGRRVGDRRLVSFAVDPERGDRERPAQPLGHREPLRERARARLPPQEPGALVLVPGPAQPPQALDPPVDAADQLRSGDRLRDIVVAARREQLADPRRIRLGGQEQDRQRAPARVGAQRAAQLDPADLRHLHVEHHQIGRRRLHAAQNAVGSSTATK